MRCSLFVSLLLVASAAHAGRPAESWPEELASDFQQASGQEALNDLAKKAGAPNFGTLLKAIPVDDWSAAAGAASGGDGQAAQQAFARGLLKALTAIGVDLAIGTGASAAAPFVASVGAAFLVGKMFDVLVSDDQAETAQRMRELELRLQASKNEAERKKLQFDRDMLRAQLVLLAADATSMRLDADALLAKLAQGKISREQYAAEMRTLQKRHAEVVKGYAETRAKLVKLQPSNQEAKLAELKERHRQLKAQLDASGGHDQAAYAEMKAVYQEYMALKKSLEKR